jgi:MoxR-like ATPase
MAWIEGRDYVIPDDIKRLTAPVFGHRVVINTRVALAQRRPDLADRIIQEVLDRVDVPL